VYATSKPFSSFLVFSFYFHFNALGKEWDALSEAAIKMICGPIVPLAGHSRDNAAGQLNAT